MKKILCLLSVVAMVTSVCLFTPAVSAASGPPWGSATTSYPTIYPDTTYSYYHASGSSITAGPGGVGYTIAVPADGLYILQVLSNSQAITGYLYDGTEYISASTASPNNSVGAPYFKYMLKGGNTYYVWLTCMATTSYGFYVQQWSTGDVDGNGTVTNDDANLILSYAVGNITLDDMGTDSLYPALVADVNGDGSIDTIDASKIMQYASGKITNFYSCAPAGYYH